MLKLLAKVAEKYAKSTNTACFIFGLVHQPKMINYNINKYKYFLKTTKQLQRGILNQDTSL